MVKRDRCSAAGYMAADEAVIPGETGKKQEGEGKRLLVVCGQKGEADGGSSAGAG
jgi:hypothetical protein